MIRLLTPDDLPAAIEVADSRRTFQGLQLDDETHLKFRTYILDNRLSVPCGYFFFGYFDDETGELKAWASSNTMPNWEYNISISYTKPGLPKMEGEREVRVAQALIDLRNYITDYWRAHHFLVCWNARPNFPSYMQAGPTKMSMVDEYKRETFCILPANAKLEDPVLQRGVMGNSTIRVPQAILKFTDLKPVPVPYMVAQHGAQFATHPLIEPAPPPLIIPGPLS